MSTSKTRPNTGAADKAANHHDKLRAEVKRWQRVAETELSANHARVAALKADKRRLDWCIEKMDIRFYNTMPDCPREARAAIDAAIKEDTK